MRIGWLLVIAVAVLASGCVSSEQGLCPPGGGDQAIFDPALIGDWVSIVPENEKEQKHEEVFRAERLREGSKTYRFVAPMGKQFGLQDPDSTRIEGHLVAVGKQRYLDVAAMVERPPGPQKGPKTRHSFCKCVVEGNMLVTQGMDFEFLAKHPEALAHRIEETDGKLITIKIPIITASSAEIAAFLERHEHDPDLWRAEGIVKYHRR